MHNKFDQSDAEIWSYHHSIITVLLRFAFMYFWSSYLSSRKVQGYETLFVLDHFSTISRKIFLHFPQISVFLVRDMVILKHKRLFLFLLLMFKIGTLLCAASHTLLAMDVLFPDVETLHIVSRIILLLYAITAVVIIILLCKTLPMMVRSLENMKLNDQGFFEHADSYLIDIINSLQESIIVLSHDSVILRGNRISTSLFGQEFIGRKFESMIHGEDVAEFQKAMQEVLNGEDASVRTVEYRVHNFNHKHHESSVTVQDTYLPSRGGDSSTQYTWVESILCRGRGRSSFHRSAANYGVQVKMLSRNVDHRKKDELFQQYFEMTKEQERVNEAKMRYISCIAHDLKTPLQSFCFTVDLLLHTQITPEQAELLSHTTVAVDLMKLTISQTMDISKALTGVKLMPRRSAVHLSSIVERVSIIM